MKYGKSLSVEYGQNNQTKKAEQDNTPSSQSYTALGYLKAFIIVFVVAHHAALAYFPFLPTYPASSLTEYFHSIRSICPINDEQRSMIFFLFTLFNDKFAMSLMFFISGLFVWKSIQSKDKFIFFRDRLIRLGLPFIVMLLITPFTFYPTYLQTDGSSGFSDFWQQLLSVNSWGLGPIWFIWLLLAFNILALLISAIFPKIGDLSYMKSLNVMQKPGIFFALLILISAAAYIPMTFNFHPDHWWHWGPFQSQTSRIFLYFIYFLLGVALGVYGIARTFLVSGGALARRWIVWVIVALAAFPINIVATFTEAKQILTSSTFTLSCAAISLAFLAIFLRFVNNRNKIFDSLSVNGYGIFMIHYGVVSWLQYSLLKTSIPAIAKGTIVFVCALAICWGTISIIRRIPRVARII
jgi:hypothetical protein